MFIEESAFGSGSDRTGFSSAYTSDRIASSLGNIASCPAIQTFKDFRSNQVHYIHINVYLGTQRPALLRENSRSFPITTKSHVHEIVTSQGFRQTPQHAPLGCIHQCITPLDVKPSDAPPNIQNPQPKSPNSNIYHRDTRCPY